MWDLLFDWQGLVQQGADAATYFLMALIGTLLFVVRLVFALFGGDADGGDFDAPDGDFGTDASFTLFSLLSVMAFIMGTGWMGLAARFDWDLGRVPSFFVATGFGLTMMLTASGLMFLTRKLNQNVQYDVATAVGKTARVYLTIPKHGKGHGQVEVVVSGRKKILRAQSNGPTIAAFADVKVLEVRDDETLVVEPLN